MKHSKIAIIGIGNVGSTIAYALILKNIAAEIILVDPNQSRCQGEFLDLSDTLLFSSTSTLSIGTLEQAAQADIIIITAGVPQTPGQSRIDLLKTNSAIVDQIIDGLKPLNNNAIILVIANPVDLIAYHIQKKQTLPQNQIFGSGTLLDTLRLKSLISAKLGISIKEVHTFILGEHGDTQFPAWSLTQCAGKQIDQIEGISKTDLDQFAQATKEKAYEIIRCKGSTYYGIGICTASMCEAIIFDQKQVMPVSAYHKEFDMCFSMPCIIGEHGVESSLPISLNQDERLLLQKSIETLKSLAVTL